jgi:hypothetical protein
VIGLGHEGNSTYHREADGNQRFHGQQRRQFEGVIGNITPRSVYTRNDAGREDFPAAIQNITGIISLINASSRSAVRQGLSSSIQLGPVDDAVGKHNLRVV